MTTCSQLSDFFGGKLFVNYTGFSVPCQKTFRYNCNRITCEGEGVFNKCLFVGEDKSSLVILIN